jgi:DNA replication protein DnaC
LAISLGIAACGQAKKVRFFRVTELITQLLEAKEERQLLRIRGQLAKLDLLVLDELGYVPASKAGAELLFDVIATAYERNSMLVTTNLPFENWTEVLGSERLTGGGSRAPDASMPYCRNQGRELSPPRCQTPPTRQGRLTASATERRFNQEIINT